MGHGAQSTVNPAFGHQRALSWGSIGLTENNPSRGSSVYLWTEVSRSLRLPMQAGSPQYNGTKARMTRSAFPFPPGSYRPESRYGCIIYPPEGEHGFIRARL